MDRERLGNLDVLRALAALIICFYHYLEHDFSRIGAVATVLQHGPLAVDVFFVVSGFVIPLALARVNFRLADSKSFLAARMVRLYPAYAVTAVLAIALWYLGSHTPGFRGKPFDVSAAQLAAHALLACDLVRLPWVTPVFWTLAIEFQFYLLITLSFPFLHHRNALVRHAALWAWIACPAIVGGGVSVFSWTALFATGLLCFLKRAQLLGPVSFWIYLGLAIASHGLVRGVGGAMASAVSGLAILYLPEVRSRTLLWIGTISYSFYLVHLVIGIRVLNLAKRLPEPPLHPWPQVIVALLVSLGVAALFYELIEKPSHEFSRRVRKALQRKPQRDAAREMGPAVAVAEPAATVSADA
ncbi:MAG: acyltransferase family protein [Acidobacteria bacterium]|nr:acyltransferase family protein [Acidobacteriota bacterium]